MLLKEVYPTEVAMVRVHSADGVQSVTSRDLGGVSSGGSDINGAPVDGHLDLAGRTSSRTRN